MEDPLQGRQAFARYVPADVVQCFSEAGLLDGSAPGVVTWWDQRAALYRATRDAALTEIGREGERLTVKYELARTGIEPRWIALDYNDAGFDVLSQVSNADKTSLSIEVKTSTHSWESAWFYLTRNEWDLLNEQANAVVHLWCVATRPATFACIPIESIRPHIAIDQGNGRWHIITCPFRCWASSVPAF